jgi:hypothetical protein
MGLWRPPPEEETRWAGQPLSVYLTLLIVFGAILYYAWMIGSAALRFF